jgi:hypothetical protein
MATILNTTQVYAAADVVTHTNLNNIITGTTFQAGVDGATDDVSLEVASGGSLQIKDDGVTTPKILDANVTKAKIENVANLRVLGNTSGSAVAPQEVEILDDDTMATADASTLATSESIKAYVDSLRPNISQLIFTETYSNLNPQSQWLDFGTATNPFEVSITPRLGNSKLKFTCSIASSTNNSSHQNFFKLQRRIGPASLTNDFEDVTGSMGPVSGVRTQCSFSSSYPGQYSCSIDGMDYLDNFSYTQGEEITYRVLVWGITTVDIYINRAQTNGDNIRVPSLISTAMIEEIYQ